MLDRLVNPKKLNVAPLAYQVSPTSLYLSNLERAVFKVECNVACRVQLSTLRVCRTLLDDDSIRRDKEFEELRALIKHGIVARRSLPCCALQAS